MKKGDDVYFLTLVDFLITALFFGLVLFATGQTKSSPREDEIAKNQIDQLKGIAGVSSFAELTDYLTRLVPFRNAPAATTLVEAGGGESAVKELVRLQKEVGGLDSLKAILKRARAREGAFKPHCLYVTDAQGEKTAIPIARLVATDSHMEFVEGSESFTRLLDELNISFENVRVLSFGQFRKMFQSLQSRPCEFTVTVIERTNLKYPRDAMRGLFYPRLADR